MIAVDTAAALTRARVLLAQADEMRIGPMFWYRLSLAATQLSLAGRQDLSRRVFAMLHDGNWRGLHEVLEALEGERV